MWHTARGSRSSQRSAERPARAGGGVRVTHTGLETRGEEARGDLVLAGK